MNQIIEFNEIGRTEVLQYVSKPIPEPKDEEVVVKVMACGLNRAEYMFFNGQYLFQPHFPSKLGIEGSGIIHKLGENVTNFQIGDEVCMLPNTDITNYGYLGEYALASAQVLIAKPKQLDFEQAAAFWAAYGTAYGLLVNKGGLENNANQTVLITAASSSVGIACIEVAKNHGARVIATTRKSEKKNFLLQSGADFVIVTDEQNLVEEVQRITKGKGFNIGVDAVTGSTVNQLAEAAALEAKIILYGVLDFNADTLPLFPILSKGVSISGFHLGFHLLNIPDRTKAMQKYLLESLEKGYYLPKMDKLFSFNETKEAYQYLESNQQKGKIVVRFSN